MAKKTNRQQGAPLAEDVEIANAGVTVNQEITSTLKENYMPYTMSVIVSRALPEIDGLKPAHRKLLYTMYLMGLLGGQRTKSANVVGQTMKLNPHGDAAIYETMVRMTRGNETLLHPYVDSKGNFGKCYSSDTMYAAARYTEVRLADITNEMFSEIKSDAVEFVPNYDNQMLEPRLLPVTFPTILTNPNLGIAVGMASNICSFNLAEVCETTAKLIKNNRHDILSTLKAPDFSTGAYYLYDAAELNRIYETGQGKLRFRSKYEYDPKEHCIEITQIPPTTTVERILDVIVGKIKAGSFKEISAIRDETDKKGLRLTIDIKRGTDPDKLMQKLFRQTPLEDSFACNFTVLVNGVPKQLGVRDIILEWVEFRRGCIKRRTSSELKTKLERLHLLEGLSKILLDIDKAISIIRDTERERDVISNLMIGFGIDETQAEYIAEIKLRHLNREYIINRVSETDNIKQQIAELRAILADDALVDKIIISEQAEVAKKYVQPRKTKILFDAPVEVEEPEEKIPDYPVSIFYTREGYFKKITPLSLRMSSEHKHKENDKIVFSLECKNDINLLFFTSKCNVYKAKAADFGETKASLIGDYIPSSLDMDEGETCVGIIATEDYEGWALSFYANGKVSRVPLSLFKTVKNRKKLQNAYSGKSPLVAIRGIKEQAEFALISSKNRMLLANSALIPEKQTKDTIGVSVMTLKKDAVLERVLLVSELEITELARFRTRNLPAAGAMLKDTDINKQLSLL